MKISKNPFSPNSVIRNLLHFPLFKIDDKEEFPVYCDMAGGG